MRQVLFGILRGAADIRECHADFSHPNELQAGVHQQGTSPRGQFDDLMDQLRHALVFERVGRIARRMIIRVAVERRVGEHHSGITKSPVVEVIREVDTWDGAGRVGGDDRQIAAGQHRSFDGAHKRGLTHVGYENQP